MSEAAELTLAQAILEALGEAVRIEAPDGRAILTTARFRAGDTETPTLEKTFDLAGLHHGSCRVVRQPAACDQSCGMLVRARHTLRQPLAAIAGNAQAARRLLSQPRPDVSEVQMALADIESDLDICQELLRSLEKLVDCPAPTPMT
jgi:hypothetical protein